MSTCCLCSGLVSPRHNEIWNKPIFESPNFVALPSLGSLVEGWTLIVPRMHFIAIGALPSELHTELNRFRAEVSTVIRRHYGEVCIFEHGPGAANRQAGCGVDHAHLHIVPVNFDIAKAAAPFMPVDAKWSSATWQNCKQTFESGQDYLYLEQPVGIGRIAVHRNFGSQVFRRAIATYCGVPEQFNWREYPQTEVVAQTIETLLRPADMGV